MTIYGLELTLCDREEHDLLRFFTDYNQHCILSPVPSQANLFIHHYFEDETTSGRLTPDNGSEAPLRKRTWCKLAPWSTGAFVSLY